MVFIYTVVNQGEMWDTYRIVISHQTDIQFRETAAYNSGLLLDTLVIIGIKLDQTTSWFVRIMVGVIIIIIIIIIIIFLHLKKELKAALMENKLR